MKDRSHLTICLIIIIVLLSYYSITLLITIGMRSLTTRSKLKSEIINKNFEIRELKEKVKKCKTEEKKEKCSYDLKSLYGTYYGEKNHPNNNLFVHKVELTLNENNEAILHQSDGASANYTTGSFICDHNRIIYTPLYNDYENQEKTKVNQDDLQYTFIINGGTEIELNYFYASTFPINMKIKK